MKKVRYPNRMTVDFPEKIYRQLHIHKLDTKETVKDFIIRAVEKELKGKG